MTKLVSSRVKKKNTLLYQLAELRSGQFCVSQHRQYIVLSRLMQLIKFFYDEYEI